MASTFSDLGIELMATGENAGTWGDKTNTNLQIVEKAIAGYVEKSIAGGAQTTTLSITDGDTTESTSVARHAVIKLTGTITGNQIVTVPDSIEKVYIVVNGTSGAYTVQFKTASGTGITFGTTDKGTRLLFSDGTNIVDTGFSTSVAADDISTGDAAVTIATSSGDITVDGPSDIVLDADGGDIFFKDGGTTFGSATNTSGNLIIKSGTTTAVTFSGANATVAGNLSVGGDFDVTGSLDFSDANITNVGSIALDTITNDGTDITLDSSGDIVLDADGADIFLKDAGTTYGSLTNSSGNLIVKSGTTTALTFSGADVTIAGDLTVSGDDITMGTNTAGNLLIADGTNFNSVAVGSLTEISTVADDDVFLAVDTSGGGLKKIARSAIVSGLATSSAISNVADDSTPQLGGDLDMNGQDIVTTSNADIELAPNGTGHVTIKGNTNQGTLQLNCENNSHGQQIVAAPHSESASNVLTLPSTGGNARLVSTSSTATLTNKTLTSPKINEDVAVTATATEINLLDGVTSTTAELNILDGVTSTAAELNILDGVTSTAAELNILDGVTSTTAELNILDGVTSTAAELNILDGVTSTATELNIMDGDTSATSTTLVDADRVVTNDNGTMKQVALTDVKTYLTSAGFSTDDPTALAIALG